MRIAFSTIACPDYGPAEIRAAVREHGYDGVELYALNSRLLDPDALAAETGSLRRGLAGTPIVALNSFAVLADGEHDKLLRALELAAELECPIVKAFGGEGDARVVAAASTLTKALPRAEELGITVAVETHDGFSRGADVAALLDAVGGASAGALWDVQHTIGAGESLAETAAHIGTRVVHAHVKDARRGRDGWTPVPLGEGELPLRELASTLGDLGYAGCLSYDYEKYWHDELPSPSSALPAAAVLLRELTLDAAAA